MIRPDLLRAAPELAHLPVLLAALDSLETLLLVEHPTIAEPGPHPPPTLLGAVLLRARIRSLRREIRRYRRCVRNVVSPGPPSPRDDSAWPF